MNGLHLFETQPQIFSQQKYQVSIMDTTKTSDPCGFAAITIGSCSSGGGNYSELAVSTVVSTASSCSSGAAAADESFGKVPIKIGDKILFANKEFYIVVRRTKDNRYKMIIKSNVDNKVPHINADLDFEKTYSIFSAWKNGGCEPLAIFSDDKEEKIIFDRTNFYFDTMPMCEFYYGQHSTLADEELISNIKFMARTYLNSLGMCSFGEEHCRFMDNIYKCVKYYCELIKRSVAIIPCKWHLEDNICNILDSHKPWKFDNLNNDDYFAAMKAIINCPNIKDHLSERIIYKIRNAYLSKGGKKKEIITDDDEEEEYDDEDEEDDV